jgi:hypothetical protein
VNVVAFTVELYQLGFKIIAHASKKPFQRHQMIVIEDSASIFCNKDQMGVKLKNAMATGSK